MLPGKLSKTTSSCHSVWSIAWFLTTGRAPVHRSVGQAVMIRRRNPLFAAHLVHWGNQQAENGDVMSDRD
jgi:hypothetical protein